MAVLLAGILRGMCRGLMLVVCGKACLSTAFAVKWEEQVERLQNVSASLLDAYPVGEPVRAKFAVEGKTIISLLPKLNPTIGAKKEKVPASPVHMVPTVQLSGLPLLRFGSRAGAQVWAGVLPPGGEKLFGLKAAVFQYLAGASIIGSIHRGTWEMYAPLGFQFTSSKVTGGITATDAHDEFKAKTKLVYVAPGIRVPKLSAWANLLVSYKSTNSRFIIPHDGTNLEVDDALDDALWPLVTQISVGYYHKNGVQVGLSEIFVPNRLTMPRFLISYQHTIR